MKLPVHINAVGKEGKTGRMYYKLRQADDKKLSREEDDGDRDKNQKKKHKNSRKI